MLVRIPLTVLDTTLCDTVCQLLAAGRWFFPGTVVSSTNKTDCHYWNIVESGAKNHNSNPMSKDVQFITPTCVGLWLGYAISMLLHVVYLCQILYKLFIHVFYCLERFLSQHGMLMVKVLGAHAHRAVLCVLVWRIGCDLSMEDCQAIIQKGWSWIIQNGECAWGEPRYLYTLKTS